MQSSDSPKRPALSVDIKLDEGDKKTIKMSYGLQMDIQRMIPDASSIIEVMTADPVTRDFVIRRCFTESTRTVDKIEEFVSDIPVSDPDEIEKLLTWVSDHLFYFFTQSARSMMTLGEKYKSAMPTEKTQDPPAPSTSGSEVSAS